MNVQIARTWSWRTPLWSNRQLRWVLNTCSAPRGPSMSARTQVRISSVSARDGSASTSLP